MPQVNVNGTTLYYDSTGEGEILLLIHGLGSSTRDWEMQVPLFSQYFRVVTVDVRGHGRSARPSGPYSVPLFAADIAALLRYLEGGPAHVVGISMGGMIGLQLAVDAPALLRSLVVVNALPSLQAGSLMDWLQAYRRMAIIRLLGMRGMGNFLAGRLFPEPHQEELRSALRQRWADNDTRAYLAAYRALIGWTVADKLPAVTTPTLIIAADGDYWPVAAKEAAFAPLPGARVQVIANSRHATPIDQPEAFNTAVLSFLPQVPAGG